MCPAWPTTPPAAPPKKSAGANMPPESPEPTVSEVASTLPKKSPPRKPSPSWPLMDSSSQP